MSDFDFVCYMIVAATLVAFVAAAIVVRPYGVSRHARNARIADRRIRVIRRATFEGK